MIIVKDIELYSLCEHHMLPFFGKAHIAYIPNGWITGLSKIARVVDVFARRLQVQERMTTEILHAIRDTLQPLGAAVVIEASHLCMMMRGVSKQNSVTTTSAFYGEFEKNETRSEFIKLVAADLH
jgi:GTP cyclohydrolase IA